MTEEKKQTPSLNSQLLQLGDSLALAVFGIGIFVSIFGSLATIIPPKHPTIVPQICYSIVWLICGIWVVRRSKVARKTLSAISFGIGISFVTLFLMQSMDKYMYPRMDIDQFEEVARQLNAKRNNSDSK